MSWCSSPDGFKYEEPPSKGQKEEATCKSGRKECNPTIPYWAAVSIDVIMSSVGTRRQNDVV